MTLDYANEVDKEKVDFISRLEGLSAALNAQKKDKEDIEQELETTKKERDNYGRQSQELAAHLLAIQEQLETLKEEHLKYKHQAERKVNDDTRVIESLQEEQARLDGRIMELNEEVRSTQFFPFCKNKADVRRTRFRNKENT